jgi:hypothetical protein
MVEQDVALRHDCSICHGRSGGMSVSLAGESR